MSVPGWIFFGLITGFIASKIVNKRGSGCFANIALGLIGALVGGALFRALQPGLDVMHFDLPSLLLSGLIFDIASMPLPLRVVSTIIPARYFVVVLRGVFLKGVGIDVLWTQGLAMVVFAVVGLGLAAHAFRKEIA